MAFIEIKGLYKSYGKGGGAVDVIRGVDLVIERGSTVAIEGASGVGKSTLLNIMGALDRPTRGEVFYDGEELFANDEAWLANFRNRKVGFVFQSHHLLPEFTALENVMMPALIGGGEEREVADRASMLLGEVGLRCRLDHKPGELSGGEQQRVAVVRAIMQNPELILADEPTGNLDNKTGGEVFDLLLGLSREQKSTLVVVTHNELLARSMDKRFLMKDGMISSQTHEDAAETAGDCFDSGMDNVRGNAAFGDKI